MDQIVNNLQDPSWWFTGIFFILVGVVLTKLLFSWIPFALGILGNYLPEQFSKLSRWNRRKTLVLVKNYRQNDMKVVWLIGRYWALGLFTFISFFIFVVFFSLSKDVTLKEIYTENRILILIPLYSLLLYVVAEKKQLKKVINEHHRWKRITKSSSGRVKGARH